MNEETKASPSGNGALTATAAAFVTVFGFSFALLAILPVKVPVYVPLEHRWQKGFPQLPVVGMDFYGRWFVSFLFAAVSALLAWGLVRFVFQWTPEKSGGQSVKFLSIYCFAAAGLSVFVYAYTLLFK
ncbi:MAG: hypothetical protein AB1405_06625 [Bdellovibrionota bacterium]